MSASYVIGSSRSILQLSEDDRYRLDQEQWVFACNAWPSCWRQAGFRPSVWVWGDTDRSDLVEQLATELWALRHDSMLERRPRRIFIALEDEEPLVRRTVEASGLVVQFYRRGEPWHPDQRPSRTLQGRIFHYGSTLTDLVNLAWILNPGQEIRVTGNEMSDSRLHFYGRPDAKEFYGTQLEFWQQVKRGMWEGLADLRRQHIPVVDCNLHHDLELLDEPLPRARLFA